MKLNNKKLSMDEFLKIRKEILSSYITGSDPLLDLDQAVEYLKNVPNHKNMAYVLNKAGQEGRTLVQPRAGTPILKEHIELMKYLEQAGADLLPTTIDSYTRQNRYKEAEDGIKESERLNRALLNGFPAVNYGVENCRKVYEAINVPIQARHGTPDARLLAEIIHAAGWTSNEGGGISYNIPYAKNISLVDSIKYWQYCDRLVGYYQERGVTLNREPFGPLTGTLVPPSISHTIAIVEAILAATQGVKSITVGYGQCGNVTQDIAALKTLKIKTEEYLQRFGFKDVDVTTVFHQWMGGFPNNEAEAMGLISMSATVAALGKATKMITKTPYESIGIPTKEANERGIKASKFVASLLKDQQFPHSEELFREMHQIEIEIDSLMDNIIKAGKGDIASGIVESFKSGIIDVPFAPSKYNLGKILPARDNQGYIRILEFGNLGFNDEIKEFHKSRIQERVDYEKRTFSFDLTVDDIYAVSMGSLIGRKQNK